MAAREVSTIPKKFFRYFLKGLAYYSIRLNRACTMKDLQAYVFLKSADNMNEAKLTSLAKQIMNKLVSSGVATKYNGYYRLNELLRFENGEPTKSIAPVNPAHPAKVSGSVLINKAVTFSNVVTQWCSDDEVATNH